MTRAQINNWYRVQSAKLAEQFKNAKDKLKAQRLAKLGALKAQRAGKTAAKKARVTRTTASRHRRRVDRDYELAQLDREWDLKEADYHNNQAARAGRRGDHAEAVGHATLRDAHERNAARPLQVEPRKKPRATVKKAAQKPKPRAKPWPGR